MFEAFCHKVKKLVLIFVVVVCAFLIRAFQAPVPLQKISQLKNGMTQSEVKAILGEPSKIYPSGQWTYDRLFVFGFVNLHWEVNDTYNGKYNYERF